MSYNLLYLGLVHHPVRNKRGEIVTTSVTNMDLHDISRSCRTYGFSKFYVITPLKAQHQIAARILGYWKTDDANIYNPDRKDALGLVKMVMDIEEASLDILDQTGISPYIAVTGAALKGSLTTTAKNLMAKKA